MNINFIEFISPFLSDTLYSDRCIYALFMHTVCKEQKTKTVSTASPLSYDDRNEVIISCGNSLDLAVHKN